MNIKELKKIIENLSDNMEIGGVGYSGEFLDIENVAVKKVTTLHPLGLHPNKEIKILCFDIEFPGAIEEPY